MRFLIGIFLILPIVYAEAQNGSFQKIPFRENSPKIFSCDSHGGIDCAAGKDSAKSVICIDGFRDSAQDYNLFCTAVRLQASSLEFRFPENPTVCEVESICNQVLLSIRNLSSIPAELETIDIFLPWETRPSIFEGEKRIEPYGIEEYTLRFNPHSVDRMPRPRVRCRNCETILGPVRWLSKINAL